jgi:hypothetical protein
MISSPYDTEARYSSKRSVDWVGYKVHLTETCDPDTPHLIVHVETTPAAVSDEVMVPVVHAALARVGRLPSEHLVDAGYADAPVLLESQRRYGVTLIGPVADDPSWQARSGQGLTKADFVVDWDRHVVTCPAGKQSISWLPHTYPKTGWPGKHALPARIARRARSAHAAPRPSSSRALLDCKPVSTSKPSRRHAGGNVRMSSANGMPPGPASKQPTPRLSDAQACDGVATSASKRRDSSTWQLRRL